MNKQEEIREGIQRLWCQHCKAMQKTNNTVVECWYNPLDPDEKAFCASNEDAVDAILKDEVDKGVMIKVDRELPTIAITTESFPVPCNEICHRIEQENMLETGYVAAEPLIKGDTWNFTDSLIKPCNEPLIEETE